MDDHNNNYQDDSFNLYQAYSYILLLQLEANSFNYAIVYKNRLLASAQNCSLNELTNPNQLSDLLSSTYKKVIIGLPATALTLVPRSLFSEDHISDVARLLDVNDNEKVLVQKLDDENIIIYKTSAALVSAVEKFGLQNTVYTAKGWIDVIAKSNPPNNNLYLEISKETVQFLYFSLTKLRFYNIFEFKNEDELAYFTALVTQELNLNPQYITLVLSGDVNTGDKNMNRLAEFFPNAEFNALPVLELPGQIPAHKFKAIAALSLCGSLEAH